MTTSGAAKGAGLEGEIAGPSETEKEGSAGARSAAIKLSSVGADGAWTTSRTTSA